MSSEPTNIIAWVEPGSHDLVGRVAQHPLVNVIGVGSTDTSTHGALDTALGLPVIADLRDAVRHEDLHAIWLAGPTRLSADEIRGLGQAPHFTVCTEPRAFMLEEPIDGSTVAAFPRFAPLMRRSPGYRAALSALDEFGEPHALSLCFRAAPEDGSFHARLFDAMDFVINLLGDIEVINATLYTVGDSGAGHLNAVAQSVDGRCASILVSNEAGPWRRTATILGHAGAVEIDDESCLWTAPEGTETDAAPGLSSSELSSVDAPELMAQHLIRLRDGLDVDTGELPPQNAVVAALCETAMLSTRTGQAESPETMIRMYS